MTKTLVIAAALLTLGVGTSSAAGLNLSWSDCGSFGQADRTFACDSNSGTHQLVSSFVAPQGMLEVSGAEITIDMVVADVALPPWWDVDVCRPRAIGFSTDFSAVPGTGNCSAYFASALGGGFPLPVEGGSNRMRFRQGIAMPDDRSIGPIAAGDEVYTSRIQITNAGTVGGCAGCTTGACIVLDEIVVTQVPGTAAGNFKFTSPAGRNWVTWQGGGGILCPHAVAARLSRWGTIRTLYR